MKRLISMFMLLLLTLIIAGCSGFTPNKEASSDSTSASDTDAETTITFLHRWPNEPYKTYYNEVIAEFEEQNPDINVEQTTALNDQYKQKVNVIMGGDTPPDIFFTWVGKSFGDKFINDDIALDISSYYEEDTEWSENIMAQEPFMKDDKHYGVPLYTDSKVFYYNKDIFDQYGLEAPETWEEFMSTLQTLKDNGETPLMLGNKSPWAGSHYLTAVNQRMVSQDVVEQDYTTAEFTDPMYVEALEKIEELSPYFNDSPNSVGHEEARNFFLNEAAGIMFMETFEAPYLEEAAFEWGTFNFPSIAEGEGSDSGIIGAPEGFMVSKKSENPDAAMKFLKFLTSKPMGEKLMKEVGMPSSVIGAVNEDTASEKEIELTNMIAEKEYILNWIDQGIETTVSKPYMDGVQLLIAGSITPEEVMEQVQAEAEEVE